MVKFQGFFMPLGRKVCPGSIAEFRPSASCCSHDRKLPRSRISTVALGSSCKSRCTKNSDPNPDPITTTGYVRSDEAISFTNMSAPPGEKRTDTASPQSMNFGRNHQRDQGTHPERAERWRDLNFK